MSRMSLVNKILLVFIVLVCPCLAFSAQVTLQWDANTPAPDGYKVYHRESGSSYDYKNYVWLGTGTTCTISDLEVDKAHYFVVRAFVGSEESGDSNEVMFYPKEEGGTPTISILRPSSLSIGGNIISDITPGNYQLDINGTVYDIEVIGLHVKKALIYHGNIKSKIFHSPDCRFYNCADCIVVFNSREEAIAQGYTPGGICKP